MKIENYNEPVKTKDKRRVEFIPENFRMITVGKSNCSKTNGLLNMIRRFLYFDKIIIYSNNAHQPKYEKLKEIMDEISKHVGYQVFETKGHDQIMDTTDYPKKKQKTGNIRRYD